MDFSNNYNGFESGPKLRLMKPILVTQQIGNVCVLIIEFFVIRFMIPRNNIDDSTIQFVTYS